ncbi:epoxide hydrolase family protein [Trabulsiella odontotermitis]|uniref:epoxide hydrolase family protein n=1 Tax=Trabulsiella odontotermitis TaxID=379893 RepID=UPI000676466D|nr:epoxide hydrolase family protein [Trabulsiella odontotermitis]KNC92889.1 epoxide hydrolase [Trabulsiella odontotermitis]
MSAPQNPISDAIIPFRVQVPQHILDDLHRRLVDVQLPGKEIVDNASQGPRLDTIRRLVDYWKDYYDWRHLEEHLNSYPQFVTTIDDVEIHFMHIRSKHENALPLIMTHGWPGSIIEFLDVIDPLTNPTAHGGHAEDAFHLIIPSLPGYGFSGKPITMGWNRERIARAWHTLMMRLGYKQYVAQGGDWGSHVTLAMGQQRPVGLLAIHTNLPLVTPEVRPENPSPEERLAFEQLERFASEGSSYYQQMLTRSQTIGYALSDSPTGLLAWMFEKFESWSDSDGDPLSTLGYDKILDDVTLYWVTNSATSSARLYAEHPDLNFYAMPVSIPVGVSVFPGEIWTPPRKWAEQTYPQLMYWNKAAHGGHFAAFEQPEIFVSEIRAAFNSIRH